MGECSGRGPLTPRQAGNAGGRRGRPRRPRSHGGCPDLRARSRLARRLPAGLPCGRACGRATGRLAHRTRPGCRRSPEHVDLDRDVRRQPQPVDAVDRLQPARAVVRSVEINGDEAAGVRRDRLRAGGRGLATRTAQPSSTAPTSPPRRVLLPANGSYVTPEIFAIDWIRVANGLFFKGDGTQLSDCPGYGTPIHAVADRTVVSAANNRPEVPPGASAGENPTLHTPADFTGNSVVENIGRRRLPCTHICKPALSESSGGSVYDRPADRPPRQHREHHGAASAAGPSISCRSS